MQWNVTSNFHTDPFFKTKNENCLESWKIPNMTNDAKKTKIDRWKYKWNKWLFHTLSSSVCCFTVSRSVPTGDIDASLMPAMSTQSNIAWKSQYETKYECREIVSCLKVSISKISECILLQRTILLCSLKKKNRFL